MATASKTPTVTEHDLVITRIFKAPRELVYKAWTDPEMAKQWWGPSGWTAPVMEIDVRPGGKSFSCMRGPDGMEIWGVGTYREVIPNEKIVVTDSFADEQGNVVPATHYGMGDDIPLEMMITVTFDDLGDGTTRMTLIHSGIARGSEGEGAQVGWSESFDKLEAALAEWKKSK